MENQTSTPQNPSVNTPATIAPKRTWLMVAGITALLILIVLGACLSFALLTIRDQDSHIKQLNTQVASLNQQQVATYSEKLPNGKTISYPLNPTNATIIWWWLNPTAGENGHGNILAMTSTKFMHFMNNMDPSLVQQICANDDTTGFDVGPTMQYITVDVHDPILMDHGKAGTLFLHGQAASCMDLIASSNGKYAQQAANLLQEVRSDAQAWAKSLTIK